MPNEQYSTGAAQGPPSDIYALAAVSYRVLTGGVVCRARRIGYCETATSS